MRSRRERRIVARVRIVRERREPTTIERANWAERSIETVAPELGLVVASRPMTLEEKLSILDMGIRE